MKFDLFVLEGGIGKQVAFTALIKELKKRNGVAILTPYVDIFVGIPEVDAVYDMASTPLTPEFFRKFNNIYHQDAYKGNYEKGDYHLIDAYCDICHISKVDRKPYLPQKFAVSVPEGKYVIVQFSGGQSPINFNAQSSYQTNNMRIGRNYVENAQEIVDYLISKGYKVIQYGLPNEPRFKGILTYDMPYMNYLELIRKAEFIVAIDSSLMHLTASTDTKGVILWGMTSPQQLGYKQFTNLESDLPQVVKINSEKIYKAIDASIQD